MAKSECPCIGDKGCREKRKRDIADAVLLPRFSGLAPYPLLILSVSFGPGNQLLPPHSAPETADNDSADKPSGSGSKASGSGGGDGKVDEEDVKLVVAQTGCSEEKAREALKEEKGDLINASESVNLQL
jgi:hypothetical protein